MIPGAPVPSRWLRAKPRLSLPAHVLEDIVGTAFPRCRLVDVLPLADGFRNANFRLRLDSIAGFVVLRIYEHDPSLCAKEVDLLNLIKFSVPVPAIIHAEPEGLNEIPPFVFMYYVEGLARTSQHAACSTIARAWFSEASPVSNEHGGGSTWRGEPHCV